MAPSFQMISRKCRSGDRLKKSGKWGDAIRPHLMTNNRKMDDCVLDAIPAGFRKVLRVVKGPSGRWTASIFNPSSKLSVRVGTFDTPEEAADAYINKKLELEAILHGRERCEKKTGIWYSPNTGKWGAAIRNPVSKELVWVGTYDTIEEAQTACKKTTEIIGEKLDLMVSDLETSVFKKPVGITLQKSGRWSAKIKHPVTKALLHLGTYDTPKEAQDARNAKKLVFESMFPAQRKKRTDDVEEALRRKKMELNALVSTDHLAANGVHVAVKNEDVQIPNLVEESEVVNAYGELVGEFSRIDDELLLV